MTALRDVPAYVSSLSLNAGWDSKQAESIYLADVDYSDRIDNKDLQSLLVYLANGGNGSNAPGGGSLTAVPEPGTFVLLLIGSIPGVWVARMVSRRRRGDDAVGSFEIAGV
jgi:hypothetical protein